MDEEEKKFTIVKDSGEEVTLTMLFNFENEQRGKTYYFLFDEEDPDNIIPLSSVDGEHLEYLDEEEMDEASQVLEAYQDLMAKEEEGE